MQVKSFTIGDKTYNVVRASAVQQDQLMSLLSQGVLTRLAAANKPDIEDGVLIFMFASMPFELKRQVDALLLQKVVVNGTDQTVTVNDFQGKMMELNELRAAVLRWNFDDFFTYWANEYGKESQTIDQGKAV